MMCDHVDEATIVLPCCCAMLASLKASCMRAHGLHHILIKSWVKSQIMFHESDFIARGFPESDSSQY